MASPDNPTHWAKSDKDIERMQAALSAAGPSKVSAELTAKREATTRQSLFNLQREVSIFLVLVGGNCLFLGWALLFAPQEHSSALMGWGFKGFFLYPAYLAWRIGMGFAKAKK